MIVVSDTSPISNLLKIGRIDLLRHLYQTVVIPAAVSREIEFLEENRRLIAEIEWIRVVELKNRELLTLLDGDLDSGEAEAIALSMELKADVLLIDEGHGRREAKNHGLEITGLVGVLLEAKKAGLIGKIRPEIENLATKANFWMSPQLIDLALDLASEK